MPPWVARQCLVLGLSRSATRAICHARRLQSVVRHVPSRTIAQQASQDGFELPIPGTRSSAIIIPSSITGTQPADLIRRIAPLDSQLSKDHLTVFFLTPEFATWLLDDQSFLSRALSQVYQRIMGAPQHAKIHALTAVVDKLPTPQPIDNTCEVQQEALYRMRTPPVSETGLEGMAYMTLPFSDFQYTARTSADEKGTIGFINASSSEERGVYTDILRLPLANTIFQTGSLTTLTFSTWEKQQGASEWALRSKNELVEVGLRLYRERRANQLSALSIPLIPLTIPRLVDASMGNILRRVIGADQKSVAASEELEKAVPAYFNSRDEPPQAMSVWALLIPKDTLEPMRRSLEGFFSYIHSKENIFDRDPNNPPWTSVWKSDPPEWNDLVALALSQGARLHRVLSGGGGWGKKAGLLSLDPAASAEELAKSQVQAYPGSGEEVGDLSSALQQVVHPGDSIQFFVSPSRNASSANDLEGSLSRLRQLSDTRTPWQWEFGTIPSTADFVQASSWQHNNSSSKEVFEFKNSFGALSEGAMTIQRQCELKPDNSLAVVGATKIDVPFSRFCSVCVSAQEGEEFATGESLQNFRHAQASRSDLELVDTIYSPTISSFSPPRTGPLVEDSESPPIDFVHELRPSMVPKDVTTSSPYTDVEELTEQTQKSRGIVRDILRNIHNLRIDDISNTLDVSDDHLFALQKELGAILLTITQEPISNLIYKSHQISHSIQKLEAQMARILFLVYTRARVVARTHNSAIEIYLLHTALRWRMTSLLSSYPGWSTKKQQIAKILKQLRSFNRNLFVYFKASSHRFFMDKLRALEEQYRDTLGMKDLMEHEEDFSIEEKGGQKERIARVMQHTPLGNDLRAQKMFNKLSIRKVAPAPEIKFREGESPITRRIPFAFRKRNVVRRVIATRNVPMSSKDTKGKKMTKRFKENTVRKRVRRREMLKQVSKWLGGL